MEVSIAEVVMTAEASVEGPCDVTQAPVPANMDLAANACGIFLFDPGAAFRHARIIRAGVAPARRIQHGEVRGAMSDSLAANITAVIPAQPDALYKAWIDPDILPQWLAPPPYDLVHAEVDAKVGGAYVHDVTGPDGEHRVVGKYLELTPGRHILKNWNYSGPNPAPRPEATFVEVSFDPISDSATRVTIRHYGLRDARERKHYQEGWEHCLARLRALHEE